MDLLRALRAEARGLESLELVVRYTLEISDVPDEALAGLLASELGAEAGETVMTTAEQLREQGIEQGIEQGLKEVVVNMITKGYSDEQITEITNLSIKRIQILRKERSV